MIFLDKYWKLELNEYIRQGEPEKIDKSNAWKTAIGLQDVDGLKTSDYLIETAKEHIEGKISITEADKRIHSYYEEQKDRNEIEEDSKEADIVSVRIAKLFGEKTFQFSPVEWQNIHRRLFEGLFSHAGKIRNYNITKKEWILKGDTVMYASFDSIRATLDYDFSQEKNFSYEGLTIDEAVRHIAKFTSGIWQIHPFGEGNTRSTAVFIIKYLKTFGFAVSNETFAENSWYFRNALVRANYNDLQNGVYATTEFLELFFENLLMDAGHELKNRYMHIDFENESANKNVSKCQNDTLELSLEELTIGLFNWIFVGGFFKTAYKFARPFVTFIIACFLVIFTAEALHHIPGLEKLNAFSTNEITIQLIMIVAGILIFLLVTVLSYRRA